MKKSETFKDSLKNIIAIDSNAPIKRIVELVNLTVENSEEAFKKAKTKAKNAAEKEDSSISTTIETNFNGITKAIISNIDTAIDIAINSPTPGSTKEKAKNAAKTAVAAVKAEEANDILATYAEICSSVPGFQASSINTALENISKNNPNHLAKATKRLKKFVEGVEEISQEVLTKICEDLKGDEDFTTFNKKIQIYEKLYNTAKSKNIEPKQINEALKGITTVDVSEFSDSVGKLTGLIDNDKLTKEFFDSVYKELGEKKDVNDFINTNLED